MRSRAGFSLMEIVVSLMIFSVISIAMVGIFATATNLFRAGESARTASDEAVAVLSMIDEDLRRAVAPQDGGFLFTRTSPGSNPAGNMVLALKIHNPDNNAITEQGLNGRLIVVYWIDDQGHLNRQQATAADSDGSLASVSEFSVANKIFGNPNVVANGCLYFGIDLSTATTPRSDCTWTGSLPNNGSPYRYCTENSAAAGSPSNADPFPEAMRISIVITGGSRHATQGTCISDSGNGIRVAGVRMVPIGSGAMARIGDGGDAEWIAYNNFTGGGLTWNGGSPQRDLRRTSHTAPHAKGEPVYFAPTYTLIRSFAR
jgi:hypothetical protein